MPILIFLRFFVFELRDSTGQTDKRTDGRTRRVMRPKIDVVTPNFLRQHISTTVQGRRLVQTDHI